MLQEFKSHNYADSKGNPSGGSVSSTGLSIIWQDGPLGQGEERKEPNGAFVETVIAAVTQRIEWYQEVSEGKFQCNENAWAIDRLTEALNHLNNRTERREKEGVEGTHQM